MNNDMISVAKLTELFSKENRRGKKDKITLDSCHYWSSCSGSRSSTLYL